MKPLMIPAAVAAFAFCLPAAAEPGNNFLDGYYVSGTFESQVPAPFEEEIDGDGGGVKGAIELLPDLYLTGEYQSVEFDEPIDSGLKLNQFRVGGGFGPGVGHGGGLYGRVEYVSIDDDDEDDEDEQAGIGGQVGFALPLSELLRLHAEVGYLSLDELEGPEFVGGVTVRLARNLGLFADYRFTELEFDDGEEISLEDFRIGARFYF
ncbi:MAG: outer membrane beta-barrel protein [Panacagrimonas sp.]